MFVLAVVLTQIYSICSHINMFKWFIPAVHIYIQPSKEVISVVAMDTSVHLQTLR